jgi:DNA-binding SARP family transcriptional activator
VLSAWHEVVRGYRMLLARAAAPLPALAAGHDTALGVAGREASVIDAVPGAVAVTQLAAHLVGRGCRPIWARLAPFELDVSALSRLARVALDHGLGAMADHNVPAPGRAVAVVESPDTPRARACLDQMAPALEEAFGAGRTERVVLHLMDDADSGGPRPVPQRPLQGQGMGEDLGDEEVRARLIRLLAGRPCLLQGVARTHDLVGRSVFTSAVVGAVSADDLTRALSAVLLAGQPREYRHRLRMAAVLGYAHQRLAVFDPVLADGEAHPWWIPLEGGWYQFDTAWRAALAGGTNDGALPVSAVARLVGELLDLDAAEEALEFCLDTACPGLASDLLAETTTDLLAQDRTRALHRWLRRLPPQEHARHAALLARIGPLPTLSQQQGPATRSEAGRRRWWGRHARHAPAPPEGSAPSEPSVLPEQAASPDTAPRPDAPPTHEAAHTAQPLPVSPLVVSVRLLGTIDIRLDGHPVEHWYGKVGRTALAYVLLQRRPVLPDELAGALWPDVPITTARNRMHVAVHRLRADLSTVDPRPVLVHDQGYRIDPLVRLDLDTDRFERLGRLGDDALRGGSRHDALAAYLDARDCYHGELLSGERDEEWALLAREHYRVRLLDLLGKAAQLALDLDRPALTVDLGNQLLALDFCREDLHRLLMRAYTRLGQPQLALRQYQTCVRQLRLEFDLDPAPATVKLYQSVRADHRQE